MEELDNHQLSYLAQRAIHYLNDNQRDKAGLIYSQLVDNDTDDIEAIYNLGVLSMMLGENSNAIDYFSHAIELQPDNSNHHFMLANACFNDGKTSEAKDALQKSMELNPENPAPYIKLGQYEFQARNYPQAIELYEKAIALKPGQPGPYFELVIALRYVGRHQQALEYARKMVKLDPSAASHDCLGRTYSEMGDVDNARRHIEKAISLDATYGASYYDLSNLKKYSSSDRALITRIENNLRKQMPARERSLMHFALGKIYDDCGEWDSAFENYRQANMLVKDAVEPTAEPVYFKRAKKVYTGSLLKRAKELGDDSRLPVFIVGMPRSGTTLLEQIVASHPQAAGAGELAEIAAVELRLFPDDHSFSRAGIGSLTKNVISEQASIYLEKLREGRETVSRVVDKMPDNFLRLGLIHMLFPQATIIHAVRNPLDTCLSCYFQAFRFVRMSYDLDWLANYYNFYREVMDYWKKILPEGAIVDISYDRLIENPETISRDLIEACGLQWDPACLEFYKADRAVTTTSLWQVRQPVYASSRRRWLHYANHVSGLAKRLKKYLDDDDAAELEKRGIHVKSRWNLTSRVISR